MRGLSSRQMTESDRRETSAHKARKRAAGMSAAERARSSTRGAGPSALDGVDAPLGNGERRDENEKGVPEHGTVHREHPELPRTEQGHQARRGSAVIRCPVPVSKERAIEQPTPPDQVAGDSLGRRSPNRRRASPYLGPRNFNAAFWAGRIAVESGERIRTVRTHVACQARGHNFRLTDDDNPPERIGRHCQGQQRDRLKHVVPDAGPVPNRARSARDNRVDQILRAMLITHCGRNDSAGSPLFSRTGNGWRQAAGPTSARTDKLSRPDGPHGLEHEGRTRSRHFKEADLEGNVVLCPRTHSARFNVSPFSRELISMSCAEDYRRGPGSKLVARRRVQPGGGDERQPEDEPRGQTDARTTQRRSNVAKRKSQARRTHAESVATEETRPPSRPAPPNGKSETAAHRAPRVFSTPAATRRLPRTAGAHSSGSGGLPG